MDSFRSFIEVFPFDLEVELLTEHELIGIPQSGERKYRVTFNAPKTAAAAKKGLFDEDIVYVAARNPTQAKRTALEWLRSHLEPREEDTRKRIPRNNYLKNIDSKYLDMKARVIGSWSDIVKLLEYVSTRREEPTQFFDDQEIEIVLDMMQNKRKNQYLSKLGNSERNTLKKLLKAVWQNPSQLAPGLQAVMRIPEDGLNTIHSTITNAPNRIADTTPAETQKTSVYRQKLTQQEVDDILGKISTYPDVLREANRLGINKSDLETSYDEMFRAEDEYHEDLKKVWKWLYNKVRLPSSAKVFGDDHASPYWAKRGINWEDLAMQVTELGLSSFSHPTFGHYEDKSDYIEWAVPFLWKLYANGPPKPRMTKVEKYKHVLDKIMQNFKSPDYAWADQHADWIPF